MRRRKDRRHDPVTLAASVEDEHFDYVVCNLKGMPARFPGNVETTCFYCLRPIYHRPYVPKRPPKICVECALKLATSKKN